MRRAFLVLACLLCSVEVFAQPPTPCTAGTRRWIVVTNTITLYQCAVDGQSWTQVNMAIGASPATSVRATENITTISGLVGYATGNGGTITQLTSKATGVTLSKACGTITMNNAALNAATIVSFTLTNTLIGANDVIVLNHASAGTIGAYTLNATAAAGSASIAVRNNTAGALSEAIVLRFCVIRGAVS